ncbi:MAG: alanine--tRNA ligase [Candidatus Paceibacterota bacterium]|jgi:alanyl-tRNA synthetase
MTSEEIRQKFLDFFKERGHKIIPSASLVPSEYGDEGTLFTSAGMQPLIPYLLGKPHPSGTRLVNVQKCVRTWDLDDVGDNRHLTFFEMMGNWSLGDYFKNQSIPWSFEFLTDKEKGLGLDPKRFYVTVFKGVGNMPRDEESIKVWQGVFKKYGVEADVAGEDEVIKNNMRIVPLGVDDNFWIVGDTGPCGADTEIFYDTRPNEGPIDGKFNELVNSFRIIEVWNNVFMEFNKTLEGNYEPLAKKNVDTGMGLERTMVAVNGVNVFETDLFAPITDKIKENANSPLSSIEEEAVRVVADHFRTAVFMITDGVTPLNTGRGYVLRRLIRRIVRYSRKINFDEKNFPFLIEIIVNQYKKYYPELTLKQDIIKKEIEIEVEKAKKPLNRVELFKIDLKEAISDGVIKKSTKNFPIILSDGQVSGEYVYENYQTYGVPIDSSKEVIKELGLELDNETLERRVREHQEISRSGSEQKFKGGLASTGEMETKYHTATHLLLASLRQVLGADIVQKGSNITAERLRLDFNWPEKLTPEQLRAVEDLVNQKITEKIPVEMLELPKDEAKKIVTVLSFDESKYGDTVKVYKIDNFSTEFCGGPHVSNTGDLGHFHITKEEAVAAGVRRIKAVLE